MNFSFSLRLKILKYLFFGIFLIFAIRLGELQIFQHEAFLAEAKNQQDKRSVLRARRGKILVRKHRNSEEVTPLATNNTLKMLSIDPLILNYPKFSQEKYQADSTFANQEKGDPEMVARLLAPILINSHCEKVEGCHIETDLDKLSPSDRMAVSAYEKVIAQKFKQIYRTRVLLETDLPPSKIKKIQAHNLIGVSIEGQSIIVNPMQIHDPKQAAQKLSKILDYEIDSLEKLLSPRFNRYQKITNKIVPDVTEKILELKKNPKYKKYLRGITLTDEYWRYYPEKTLAAQILGFTDSKGFGQYGLEGYYEDILKGKAGYIYGATNLGGQQILGSGSNISQATDGANIVLSIDRVIQGGVEKILEEEVKKYNADSGQIIVMDPKTGKILAMANMPIFDPNEFGKIFTRYGITDEQEKLDREDENFNRRIPRVVEDGQFYRYYNTWGPEVFKNKAITDLYEPGSVMKAITIAIGLHVDEIEPGTLYEDEGPIKVEGFTIRNADKVYAGPTSMNSVLNRSLNTGIAWVTRKLGAELLYDYFQKFGIGQYTDITFGGEAEGKLEFWRNWSESELITRGYGQGVSTSPLQMSLAFSVLANGGYLMKPILVEEIRYSDGTVKKFQPERVRRVISDKAYHTIKSMLKESVDKGAAKKAGVPGYRVMGKTGTSQTYFHGTAQEGEGTTIASFSGFAPFKDPKFVILVKLDYPKTSQWGSETAAITFRQVAEFLFNYFEITPDA